MSDDNGPAPHVRHIGRWIAASIASIVIAGLSAFAAGLGSTEANRVTAPATLSYSITQVSEECGSGIYLPNAPSSQLLRKPPPTHWATVESQPHAADFSQSTVQVAIQGESERTVTLTGIRFNVKRTPLPTGAVFEEPCGGPTVGRAVVVDLDASPPRVVASSSDPEAIPGSVAPNGMKVKPIEFPWTVSLTEPLLLLVIAATDSCYCTWSAELPWVSGSRQGTILVNKRGVEGFAVAGGENLISHYYLDGQWQSGRMSSVDPLSWSR